MPYAYKCRKSITTFTILASSNNPKKNVPEPFALQDTTAHGEGLLLPRTSSSHCEDNGPEREKKGGGTCLVFHHMYSTGASFTLTSSIFFYYILCHAGRSMYVDGLGLYSYRNGKPDCLCCSFSSHGFVFYMTFTNLQLSGKRLPP